MKMSKLLREKLEAAKQTDEFWMDSAKLDLALALERQRKKAGKSYADVAKALGKSQAYISKVFRGDTNLTIESMIKLARSVECNVNITLRPHNEKKNYHVIEQATEEFKNYDPSKYPCSIKDSINNQSYGKLSLAA